MVDGGVAGAMMPNLSLTGVETWGAWSSSRASASVISVAVVFGSSMSVGASSSAISRSRR